MSKIRTIIIMLIAILLNGTFSYAQGGLSSEIKDPDLEQEMAWLKAETYVITPSRIPEKIKKTASSITVITDKQIRQMGSKNLLDVLQRAVPGISAYRNPGAWNIVIRGGMNVNSNKILLMINSHPINEVETGGASYVHDTLIVDNIKRIEVLRSPGSAVYGANAFAGVINVITKEAEDIDGFELTARGGSWDSQQYNLLFGKTLGDLEAAFNFSYYRSHGFRGLVEEDFQTQIDRLWNSIGLPSNASLAPGRMDGNDEKYDVALNLKYKGFEFDGRYVDKEWDIPTGWINSLNHKSISSSKDYYLNLSYETSIVERLDIFGKAYRNLFDLEQDFQLSPPGIAATPVFPFFSIMPDGVLKDSSMKASRTGIEIQTTYRIYDYNTVVVGATYEKQKSYHHSDRANYLPTADPYVIIPLPSVTRWPDDLVRDSHNRNFRAIFIEDIWDITDDLRLTLGARYDNYSDFGSAFSPRVGLAWEYMKGYDLKLLWAHAFRAPSFFELYDPSSGNRNLGPEEIDTYEVSLGADFSSSFNGRGTFYYQVAKDSILAGSASAPWNWINIPWKVRDHGFEIEMKYDFGRGTYIAGHYNYHSYNNWATVHMGSIMSNIRLSRYFNFYVDCQFSDGWERSEPGDDRDDPSGYAIVNATLIAKKFLKRYERIELRGSVYNLLDKEYATPQGPDLPNDFPMPGINYLLELRYRF